MPRKRNMTPEEYRALGDPRNEAALDKIKQQAPEVNKGYFVHEVKKINEERMHPGFDNSESQRDYEKRIKGMK